MLTENIYRGYYISKYENKWIPHIQRKADLLNMEGLPTRDQAITYLDKLLMRCNTLPEMYEALGEERIVEHPVDVIEKIAPKIFPGFTINKESFDKARKVLNEEVKENEYRTN